RPRAVGAIDQPALGHRNLGDLDRLVAIADGPVPLAHPRRIDRLLDADVLITLAALAAIGVRLVIAGHLAERLDGRAVGAGVEDMRADRRLHDQARRPIWMDGGGVIVHREADRAEDAAAQRGRGDPPGAVPGGAVHDRTHDAGAGEAELAAGCPLGSLIDDAADRVRIGGVADAVQNDLRDGALAVVGLVARLVIDGLGQALERAVERRRIAARDIGLGRAAAGMSRRRKRDGGKKDARETRTHIEISAHSYWGGFYGHRVGKRLTKRTRRAAHHSRRSAGRLCSQAVTDTPALIWLNGALGS